MLDIFPNKPSKPVLLNTKKGNTYSKKLDKKGSIFPTDFKNILLDSLFETDFNGQIDAFIYEIEDLQNRMLSKPSLPLIEEYRQKIGFFLEKLLNCYQGHSYFKGSLQKRVELKIWNPINQELELMGKNLISKNIKGMHFLKSVGLIKGLILDLKIGKG